MVRILFVCTGNTCRSPMAEAILKSKAVSGVEVKSAGVFASNGSPASTSARTVLKENAIPEQHRSLMLSDEEITWATYILTMTEGHKMTILRQYPNADKKTFTLKEFAGSTSNQDIVDPYGGPLELYRATYLDIHSAIDKIIVRLNLEGN